LVALIKAQMRFECVDIVWKSKKAKRPRKHQRWMLRWLGLVMIANLIAACTPSVQRAQVPDLGFTGPRFEEQHFVSFDGARLGLSRWTPVEAPPHTVIIALHGMNDYAQAFYLAGPWWAERGIATYAYDARGFGRSPERGVWGGEDLILEDLRVAVKLARQTYPDARIAVVGESMGAATILAALGTDTPLQADRVILIAPAVWGWSNLPLHYKVSLWLTAHTPVSLRPVNPPRAVVRKITASDNVEMLRKLGRDPNMLFATRLDAVYGLVRMMEKAFHAAKRVPPETLMLYGTRDQIIPRPSVERTVMRLPDNVRTIEYPDGYHMLTRDLQAERVWADIEAFMANPDAPLPSQLGPIRLTGKRATKR
jgi:acylglycerol lipase